MFRKLIFLLAFPLLSWADKVPAQPEPSVLEKFFPLIILVLVFYFLFIRPQQRKYKDQRDFLTKIKKGDEVLTHGGIYGKIEGLTDHFVILEVAKDVQIRVLKSQMASYAHPPENKASQKK